MKRGNAVKYINVADKPTKKHLKEAIEKIPFGDIKKLQGIDNGYRLRVGDLKVLFSIEDDRIYIDILFQKDRHIKGYRNRPDNTVSWQNAGSGFGNSRKKWQFSDCMCDDLRLSKCVSKQDFERL